MAIRAGSVARLLVVVVLAAAGASCGSGDAETRVVPGYDTFTSRLIQLSADLDRDGRLDQWTYMEGNRPLRGEADTDADGRIDRWEYFDARASLVHVGTSSLNDGVEDQWTSPVSANGELQVARSRHRDRAIDRREVLRGGVLLRAEEDTNADGRPDKWDIYEGGTLREARFDTTLSRGRADRRLVYDGQGQLAVIEQDDDGDGRFERLAVPVAAVLQEPTLMGTKR